LIQNPEDFHLIILKYLINHLILTKTILLLINKLKNQKRRNNLKRIIIQPLNRYLGHLIKRLANIANLLMIMWLLYGEINIFILFLVKKLKKEIALLQIKTQFVNALE
jgi:amino acid transporter